MNTPELELQWLQIIIIEISNIVIGIKAPMNVI